MENVSALRCQRAECNPPALSRRRAAEGAENIKFLRAFAFRENLAADYGLIS